MSNKAKVKEFLRLNHLKKVNQEFSDRLKESSYDNHLNISVEFKGFAPIHGVGSGRNGTSEMLEFQTELFQVRNIHIARIFGPESNYMAVYFTAEASQGQTGFGSNKMTHMDLINPEGKREYLEFSICHWAKLEDTVNTMRTKFGWEPIKKKAKQTDSNYREAVSDFYESLITCYRHNHGNGDTDFEEFLNSIGWKMERCFRYTHVKHITPTFIRQTGKTIEIGYRTRGTYNSLPQTIKISNVKDVASVSLRDLGVETEGYYSGDDRMTIRPEQLKAVLAFNKSFNRKNKT